MPGVRAVAAVRAVKIQVSTQCFTRRIKAVAATINLKVGVGADVHNGQSYLLPVTCFSASATCSRVRVAVPGIYESSVRSPVASELLANSSGEALEGQSVNFPRHLVQVTVGMSSSIVMGCWCKMTSTDCPSVGFGFRYSAAWDSPPARGVCRSGSPQPPRWIMS